MFDSDGSYVLKKTTKEVNWLREENGNFMLDMWVMPGSWVTECERHDGGFFEASLTLENRRVSPTSSDGVDTREHVEEYRQLATGIVEQCLV